MSRRVLPTATVALLLCVGLVGCGIPGESEVRVDGKGPQSGQDSGGDLTQRLPQRQDSDLPEQVAANYLTAAAGGETNEIYQRVNSYIPEGGGKLKLKVGSEPAINLVRLIGQPQAKGVEGTASFLVTIQVQQVGVLRMDGSVGEPELTERSYVFEVGPALASTTGGQAQPAGGMWVVNPPPVLLMSTSALFSYYSQRTIYFWNAGRTALVPDLRYLPRSVPKESQATELLGWLIGGPAPWLSPAAVPLPEGTSRIGNAPMSGGRLEVNLSMPASEVNDNVDLDRLFTQLAWSLLPPNPEGVGGDDGELELKIQSQRRKVADVDEYRRANQPYALTDSPIRFCVFEGAVHQLRDGEEAVESVPIEPEENRNIRSAALSRNGNQVGAALVSADGDRWRLRVATGAEPLRIFAASASYPSMERPIWLKGTDPRAPIGLVVADGNLYRFDSNAQLVRISLPGVPGRVTGVGAAPDGHRIAVIADGALYVAALSTDGGTVSVGRARRLVTSLATVTAVDWSGESGLAVAGAQPDRRSVIENIGVDGVLENLLVDNTRGDVLHLAAYPDNPLSRTQLGVMYETNGAASSSNRLIGREQVAPNPGLPPSTNPSSKPSAPFFRY
ncbi:LpqB family beta-propeller domain-containing protein [Micromonospora sp. NBC_01699]|uniref:LpqB family beta-propeller domain-containing protein n=1 Tax=Micromonospora sp. NBC_01699 TaxID=2975984 RepID=UPI002E37F8EC|nr:LpqB family beta-propeller domain-containing protein [Micromonospora sp. NBC_01699]